MRLASSLAVIASALIAGCAPPIHPARTSAAEPPSERERAAAERFARRRCSPNWKFLYPGVGQLCLGKTAEGSAIAAMTAVEAAGFAAAVVEGQPTVQVQMLSGVQNLYVYGVVEPALERQRADRRRLVPQDTLEELLVAPFNPRVLSQPDVIGGVAGLTALGALTSIFLLSRGVTFRPEHTPRLYGRDVGSAGAYPLAGAIFAAQFGHVAIGEEIFFRGYVQSGLARRCGDACGWAASSFVFGAAHATNAIGLPKEAIPRYLGVGVPLLVVVGQVIGGSYWRHGYSLAPPVAIHFWYDLLLSATAFALDPRASPISARIGGAF
jgi:membrane protease YdiL (CAAX protease family)